MPQVIKNKCQLPRGYKNIKTMIVSHFFDSRNPTATLDWLKKQTAPFAISAYLTFWDEMGLGLFIKAPSVHGYTYLLSLRGRRLLKRSEYLPLPLPPLERALACSIVTLQRKKKNKGKACIFKHFFMIIEGKKLRQDLSSVDNKM